MRRCRSRQLADERGEAPRLPGVPPLRRPRRDLNYGWCKAHSQFVKLYRPAGEFWSQCQFKALTRDRSTDGDEGTRL